jgi:uridine kinase
MEQKKVILMIGLPCSGKTTYIQHHARDIESYMVYDDFLDNFHTDTIIDTLIMGNNVFLADPRLCNFRTFQKVVQKLERFVSAGDIHLLLFENDKDKCLANNHNVKNKIELDINNFSLLYDLANYRHFNYQIIPITKHN